MDFLWILCLVSVCVVKDLICPVNGELCQLAPECVCYDREIVCEQDPTRGTPVFTIYERLPVTKLRITDGQVSLLKNICELFPKLSKVYLSTNDCPRWKLKCGRLICL